MAVSLTVVLAIAFEDKPDRRGDVVMGACDPLFLLFVSWLIS